MDGIFGIIDIVFFIIFCIPVLYLFVFSLASLAKKKKKIPVSNNNYRIAVLIPSYKGDMVIEQTVEAVLKQDYPGNLIDVVVISDHMGEEVNQKLVGLPITVLFPVFEKSSKAKALNYAVKYLEERNDEPAECGKETKRYDLITILDCDNIVGPSYIRNICNMYGTGAAAMQGHRVARNMNTDTAVLDAISEEINNAIFRQGHVNLGLSCALIGSGMAFDYKWFVSHADRLCTAGEDKELEILLLKDKIHIVYLSDTYILDEKIVKPAGFYSQRRRWIAAQFDILARSLKDLPGALLSGNMDLADKLFQWMLPPRVVLLGLLFFISVCLTFLDSWGAIKWWVLTGVFIIVLLTAVPPYLFNKRSARALFHLPLLGVMMGINIFRTKGVNKNFIHTQHGKNL